MADRLLNDYLCCHVCCETFRDPVSLRCNHSFCKTCLQQFWQKTQSRNCPVCKRRSSIGDPGVNFSLKALADDYTGRRGSVEEKTEQEEKELICSKHSEKPTWFCVDEGKAICPLCVESTNHPNHTVIPVKQAVSELKEKLKTDLQPLKQQVDTCGKIKSQYEDIVQHTTTQLMVTERQIKLQFEELHQFLRDEEETRLAALSEEEEQKSRTITTEMRKIEEQISSLSDTIRDVQQQLDEDEQTFLMNYNQSKSKVQLPVQEPELLSGLLIDVAKHLGSLKYKVWEKMQHIVTYTPVTLDPNTAYPKLSLSEDLSSVRNSGVTQQLPNNPERFGCYALVLGSVGFTSGKHSWEVEVGDKPVWDIGVAKESINRKGKITYSPENGYWVVILRNGDEYEACDSVPKRLTLQRKPQKIRVNLDYDRGKVSFYNSTDMSHIYTFTHTFTESIFPFFSPGVNTDGSNSGALQICPEKVSVTVTSPQSG